MHTFRKLLPEEGSRFRNVVYCFVHFFDNGIVLVNSVDITHIQPLSKVYMSKLKAILTLWRRNFLLNFSTPCI